MRARLLIAGSEEARQDHFREALEQGQFQLEYQSQFEVSSGRVAGVESLLRLGAKRTSSGEKGIQSRKMMFGRQIDSVALLTKWLESAFPKSPNRQWAGRTFHTMDTRFPRVFTSLGSNVNPTRHRLGCLPFQVFRIDVGPGRSAGTARYQQL